MTRISSFSHPPGLCRLASSDWGHLRFLQTHGHLAHVGKLRCAPKALQCDFHVKYEWTAHAC
jgi:hypothetical protein